MEFRNGLAPVLQRRDMPISPDNLWIHPTQIAIVMKHFYLISKSPGSNILKIYYNVLSGTYIFNVKSKMTAINISYIYLFNCFFVQVHF